MVFVVFLFLVREGVDVVRLRIGLPSVSCLERLEIESALCWKSVV